MHLKSLELSGFKSFAKKGEFLFSSPITAIVGPNGSGKSNVAEAFRFVLGEQSIKSLRGKKGEDLIWGGSEQVARSGRASVKVLFDNSKKLFDVDFDEVSIERTVHRDGVNQYAINGSQVRLRDVTEMLAGANIGSSGHHIISQGEADRILSASPRERREMIEDALGLRIFHYKITESERKLLRTKENIDHVQSLRKEIAPHLKFLRRQVEKIEKTLSLRDDLATRYQEYLKREELYLAHTKASLEEEKRQPEAELAKLEQELAEAKSVLKAQDKAGEKQSEIMPLEGKLRSVRERKDELARKLGRLEGELAALERNSAQSSKEDVVSISLMELKDVQQEIERHIQEGERVQDVQLFRDILKKIRTIVTTFVADKTKAHEQSGTTDVGSQIEALQKEKESFEKELQEVAREEEKLNAEYETLKRNIDAAKDEGREAERTVFTIMNRQNELRSVLSEINYSETELARAQSAFERELKEGAVLVGREILSYKRYEISKEKALAEERDVQEKRGHEIEKMKIRLEEAGGDSSEEVMKEYEEVSGRDQFLEREIEDLEKSASSLNDLIKDLQEKLGTRFSDGMAKVNKEFQNFFEVMFGGGSASLSVVKEVKRRRASEFEDVLEDDEAEEPEVEEGIDISVTLPRKRIKGLAMLSGGERALTSIALLFAMSQVNPPPFLILDETDAALDEANSRRYGDMIENLAKHSQLILITHNRETMKRAGVLYGVTMGRDGVSKLLSVQFDEAVAVAK